MLVFQSDNVVLGAIFGISGHLSRLQLLAKAGAEDQIEHGLVLHHLRRGNQRGQDNARFATIHHVVGLISKMSAIF